jgi:hypothetical protein
MQKDISSFKLEQWISNMNTNPQMPFGTISALISLQDLESYIQKIKAQQADSIRVYFVRFQTGETLTESVPVNGKLPEGCIWQEVANGFTQASVAIVPAKNFKHDDDFIFSADDIVINDQVTTLFPGVKGEGTALNPPAKPIEPKKRTP